jgi:hypothetical protein
MKICVISPFVLNLPPKNTLNPSPASKQNILDFISHVCDKYNFIVLAGYNTDCYPTEGDVQNELKQKQSLEKKQSVATVFIETGGRNFNGTNNSVYPPPLLNNPDDYKAFFVSASNIFAMPKQIFSQVPNPADIYLLQQHIQERFYDIRNKKILLLICGEIDVFTYDTVNNKNIVEVDFGNGKENIDLEWKEDKKDGKGFDIIINPTYTPRIWTRFKKKLRNLSMNQKIVIHTANNNRNHKNLLIGNIKAFFKNSELHIRRYNAPVHNLTWASFEIKVTSSGNEEVYHIDENHNSTTEVIYRPTYV